MDYFVSKNIHLQLTMPAILIKLYFHRVPLDWLILQYYLSHMSKLKEAIKSVIHQSIVDNGGSIELADKSSEHAVTNICDVVEHVFGEEVPAEFEAIFKKCFSDILA